jgi:hypothetical protein
MTTPANKTTEAIFKTYEEKQAKTAKEKPRKGRLGCGRVGMKCERALWYEFRQCTPVSFGGRMLRLFDRGQIEEPRIVADLRNIGCTVHEVDASTGGQFAVSALGGHLAGYMDGAALGVPEAPDVWHLLEFKTINKKGFSTLSSQGAEKCKPEHFGQMQLYMHLGGLKWALYICCNKDTDELYAERIEYDKAKADLLMQKSARVVEDNEAPARVSEDSNNYLCRFCDHKPLCFGSQAPAPAVPCEVNCRTCAHSTADTSGEGGKWHCDKHNHGLNVTQQKAACDSHLFLPSLVRIGTPVDGDGDHVKYEKPDGTQFINSAKEYTSKELATLPDPIIGAGLVDDVKTVFDVTLDTD